MSSGHWQWAIGYRLSDRLPANLQSHTWCLVDAAGARLASISGGLPTIVQATVFALRPGLPFDFLPIAHHRLLPGALGQLEGFAFGHRHAAELRAVRVREAAPDHRAPGVLQFIQGIDQQRARQRRDDLSPFARELGVVNEILPQLEGREL